MAAQFPTPPNTSFPLEPVGPTYLTLQDIVPKFHSASMKEFKDGGASYGLPNANSVLRWSFLYDGLTLAEVTPLDAHYVSAKDIFEGFLFRHPRTDVLYNDVHYETYEYSGHTQLDIQQRRIVLVKRPTG